MPLYRTVSDRGLWKKYNRNADPQTSHFHKPNLLNKSGPQVTYSQLELGDGYRYNSRQSIPDVRRDVELANAKFDEAYSDRGRRSRYTKSCPTTPRATTPTRTLSRSRYLTETEPEPENYYINQERARTSASQYSYANGSQYNGTGQYYPDDDRYSFESRSLTAYSNYSEKDSVHDQPGFRYPYAREPLYKDQYNYNYNYPDQPTVERENPFQYGKSVNSEADHVVQMFLQKSFFPSAANNYSPSSSELTQKQPGRIEDFDSPSSPTHIDNFNKVANGFEPPNATSSPVSSRVSTRSAISELKKNFLSQEPDRRALQKPKGNKYLRAENRWKPTSPSSKSETDSSYHSMYSPVQQNSSQGQYSHNGFENNFMSEHKNMNHFMSDTVTAAEVPQLHHAEVVRVRKDTTTTNESSEGSSEDDEREEQARRISVTINPLQVSELRQETVIPPILGPPPQTPQKDFSRARQPPNYYTQAGAEYLSGPNFASSPAATVQPTQYSGGQREAELRQPRDLPAQEQQGHYDEQAGTNDDAADFSHVSQERSFQDPAFTNFQPSQPMDRFKVSNKPKKKGFFSMFKKQNKKKYPYGDDYIHIEPKLDSPEETSDMENEMGADISSSQSPHFHILKRESTSSDDQLQAGRQPVVPMPGSGRQAVDPPSHYHQPRHPIIDPQPVGVPVGGQMFSPTANEAARPFSSPIENSVQMQTFGKPTNLDFQLEQQQPAQPVLERKLSMSKPTNLDDFAPEPEPQTVEPSSEKAYIPEHERTQEIDIDALLALSDTPEETEAELEEENRCFEASGTHEEAHDLSLEQKLLEEEQRRLEEQNLVLQQQLIETQQQHQMIISQESFTAGHSKNEIEQESPEHVPQEVQLEYGNVENENNSRLPTDEEVQAQEEFYSQRRKPKSIFNFDSFKKTKKKSRPDMYSEREYLDTLNAQPPPIDSPLDSPTEEEKLNNSVSSQKRPPMFSKKKTKSFGTLNAQPPPIDSPVDSPTEEEKLNNSASSQKRPPMFSKKKTKSFGSLFTNGKQRRPHSGQFNDELENSYVPEEPPSPTEQPVQQLESPDSPDDELGSPFDRRQKKKGLTNIFGSYKNRVRNKDFSSVPKLAVEDAKRDEGERSRHASGESNKSDQDDLAQKIVREIQKSTTELNEKSQSMPKLNSSKGNSGKGLPSLFGASSTRLSMRKSRSKSGGVSSDQEDTDEPLDRADSTRNSSEQEHNNRSQSFSKQKKKSSSNIASIFGVKNSKTSQRPKRRPVSVIGSPEVDGYYDEDQLDKADHPTDDYAEEEPELRNSLPRRKQRKSSSGFASMFGLDSSREDKRRRSQSRERQQKKYSEDRKGVSKERPRDEVVLADSEVPSSILNRAPPARSAEPRARPDAPRASAQPPERMERISPILQQKFPSEKVSPPRQMDRTERVSPPRQMDRTERVSPPRQMDRTERVSPAAGQMDREDTEERPTGRQSVQRPTDKPPLPPSVLNTSQLPAKSASPYADRQQTRSTTPAGTPALDTSFDSQKTAEVRPRQMGRQSGRFRKSILSDGQTAHDGTLGTGVNRQSSFSSQSAANNAQAAFMDKIMTTSRRNSITSQGAQEEEEAAAEQEYRKKSASVSRTESYRRAKTSPLEDSAGRRRDTYNSLPRSRRSRNQQQLRPANSDDSLRNAVEHTQRGREEGGRGRQRKGNECSVM